MNEIYQQLVTILHSMWQRRWYALITAWAITLLGWGLVATIPDKYRSSARIYIDTQSMLRPLMQGLAADTNVLAQVSMMQRTLLSRPNIEKVVRMTDMDLSVKNDVQMQQLVNRLQQDVSISFQGGNLFRVSYEDEDPKLAKRVVQSLLTIFVEGNLGASRTDLAGARRFIGEQLREYERQLEEAERRRAEFERKNAGFLPGESNYFKRLQNAKQKLEGLQKQYREAKISREELAKQFKEVPRYLKLTTPTGPGYGGGGPGNSALVSRIRELEKSLTQLKMRGYTDKHPDVVMTQRMLDAAKEELENEQGSGDDGSINGMQANTTVVNPVYDQIQIKIIDKESEMATLRSRIEDQKAEITRLEELAQTVPVIEAERMKLNRDYNIIRQKYEELLNRRESARMAQDLDSQTDNVQFRVIDPPEEPLTPSSPNRPLYLTAALVIGLAGGVAMAFVLSQIHTTFSNVERLRDYFGLPVAGAISTVLSATEQKRRKVRLALFSVVSGGLFVAFAGLMAVEFLLQPGTL